MIINSIKNNLSIVLAKENDWSKIQELNNFVFLNDAPHDSDIDLNWPFSKKGVTYYKKLAAGSYGVCYLAKIKELVVGYIALAEKDFGYRHSLYLEIENIGVHPEYRSKGIGQLLINQATKCAKVKKIKKLYVAAYWKNKKAISFYKRNGFSEIGLELERIL
ncbi:MAG: GNAT family N-acetyltransferase [Patescibacteria group bacterium]